MQNLVFGRVREICKNLEKRASIDWLVSAFAWIASAPLALGSNVIAARLLGASSFGIYATLMSASLIAAGIGSFGLGPLLTREIARSRSAGGGGISVLRRVVAWAIHTWLLMCVGASVAFSTWLIAFQRVDGVEWETVGAGVLLIFGSALSIVVAGVLSGLSEVGKAQAVRNVVKNVFVFGGVALLYLKGSGSVVQLLTVQVIGVLGAIGIGGIWIVRANDWPGLGLWSVGIAEPGTADQRARWARSSRYFFSVSMGMLVFLRLDVIVVDAVAGNAEAASFAAAARAAQIAQIAGLVWGSWLQPRVAQSLQEGAGRDVRRLMRLGVLGSFGMTTVVALCAVFLAPEIIGLFGDGFAGAILPFRILVIAYMAWSVSVPAVAVVGMGGGERTLARVVWAQVVLTLSISWPLIHAYGAVGGAVAWGLGIALGAFVLVVKGRGFVATSY